MARASLAVVAIAGCGRIGFDALPDAGAVDAAPATLVAHVIANTDGHGLTTAPVDTTGATLIALAECTWSTGIPAAPVDSLGNTWQGLTSYGANTDPSNTKLFYAVAPHTGSAHTFTDVGDDFLSIAVLAFDGPDALVAGSGGSGATPLAVAVNASAPGALVVTFACSGDSVATAISIDDGFVEVDERLNHASEAPEDMSSAYLAAATAPDVTARWAFPGDADVSAAIAAFQP